MEMSIGKKKSRSAWIFNLDNRLQFLASNSNMKKTEDVNRLDGIVYINLDHRIERKKKILREIERLQLDVTEIVRVPAIHTPMNGRKGCLLSHIAALKIAQEKQWKQVLILEDDCVSSDDVRKVHRALIRFWNAFGENWDVFLLGGKFIESEVNAASFLHVIHSLRAHAYIVNQHYYAPLQACYEQGYKEMEKDVFVVQSFGKSLDVIWRVLQKKGRWYGMQESVAEQHDGYSDIVHRCVHRKEDLFNAP